MTEGTKHDAGKLRYDLVPVESLAETARVITWGAKEYGEKNWQKVTPKERYLAALMRHVESYRAGEMRDPKTGLHHLAHAATNALFLIWFDVRFTEPEKD